MEVTYEHDPHWDGDILLGQLASREEALQAFEEGPGVHGLGVLVLVVSGETVVADDSFEHALHGVGHFLLN